MPRIIPPSGCSGYGRYATESSALKSLLKECKRIDRGYILYAVSSHVSAILLATIPRWYLYQSLMWNLLWMLPWAIAMTKQNVPEDNVLHFYAIIFGGVQVCAFFIVGAVFFVWAREFMRGRMKVP